MRAELQDNLLNRCCVIAAYSPRMVVCTFVMLLLSLTIPPTEAREPALQDNASSRETQSDAKRRLPLQHMRRDVQESVGNVIDNPSFFRRMPTQLIQCDPQLFKFIVRYPEVLVNIWDVMGITKVQVDRTGPYTFTADDSVGTTCKCDLVYGNDQVHVYYGSGFYKGNMAPRQVTGRCVCVLHSVASTSASGDPMITGSMDVFLKLDNLGADLLTRTLGPFVGKTADYNFIESAKFISQISQVCEVNPEGAQVLASKLQKIEPEVRDEFSRIAAEIGNSAQRRFEAQQLATLGPARTQLSPHITVPAPEYEGRENLRTPPKAHQESFGQVVSDSVRDQTEQLPTIVKAPNSQVIVNGSVIGNSAHSQTISSIAGNPKTIVSPKTPEWPVAQKRPIAPAKPSIYMRR